MAVVPTVVGTMAVVPTVVGARAAVVTEVAEVKLGRAGAARGRVVGVTVTEGSGEPHQAAVAAAAVTVAAATAAVAVATAAVAVATVAVAMAAEMGMVVGALAVVPTVVGAMAVVPTVVARGLAAEARELAENGQKRRFPARAQG